MHETLTPEKANGVIEDLEPFQSPMEPESTEEDLDLNGHQSDSDDHHDAETLQQIITLNREVTEARRKFERADQVRKTAKEALEEKQNTLNDFIDGLSEELPLFPDKPASPPAPMVPVAPTGEEQFSQEWFTVPLADLKMPRIVLTKLIDAGFNTIGDVSAYTDSGKDLADVPGMTEKRINEYLDAQAELAKTMITTAKPEPKSPEPIDGVFQLGWQNAPVNDLGLDPTFADKLRSNGIQTVGNLIMRRGHGTITLTEAEDDAVGEALAVFRERVVEVGLASEWEELETMANKPEEEPKKRRKKS